MNSRSIVIAAIVSVLVCAGLAVVVSLGILGPSGRTPSDPGGGGTRVNGGGDSGGTRGGAGGGRGSSSDPLAGGGGVRSPGGGSNASGASAGGAGSESPGSQPGGASTAGGTRPPGELVGLVVDEDGATVPGVKVKVSGDRVSTTQTSDPQGLVRFAKLAPGSYMVELMASGFPRLTSRQRVDVEPGATREVDLVLRKLEHEISGRVLDARGKGLEGVEIRVLPLDRGGELMLVRPGGTPGVVSGNGGEFAITGLAAGEYILETVALEGYATARRNVIAPAADVDLALYDEQRLVIAGFVRDVAGAAVPGVRVAATISSGSTSTDASGAYRLEVTYRDSPDAAIIVSTEKTGYASAQETIKLESLASREETQIDFEIEALDDVVAVKGRLVDAAGAGIAGERVYLHSTSLNARHSAVSDAAGRWSVANVRIGSDYRMWVYPRSGYRDFVQHGVEVAVGDIEFEIVLEAIEEGSLSGTFFDAEGRPLPRFTVRFRSTESKAISIAVTSDGEGRYFAESIPTGPLIIETRGQPKVSVRGLTITPGTEQTADIPIGVGDKTVVGTVLDTDGAPIAGARVIVTWARRVSLLQSTLYIESVTDEHGTFAASGLGSGSCTITVSASGFRSRAPQPLTIQPADPSPEQRIVLERL